MREFPAASDADRDDQANRPDERLDLGHDELRSNNGSRGARARNDWPDVPPVLARNQGASSPDVLPVRRNGELWSSRVRGERKHRASEEFDVVPRGTRSGRPCEAARRSASRYARLPLLDTPPWAQTGLARGRASRLLPAVSAVPPQMLASCRPAPAHRRARGSGWSLPPHRSVRRQERPACVGEPRSSSIARAAFESAVSARALASPT